MNVVTADGEACTAASGDSSQFDRELPDLAEAELVEADDGDTPPLARRQEEGSSTPRADLKVPATRDTAQSLSLPQANLDRARELRMAFENARDGTEVGERLLQDLAGTETAIALSLLDAEAAGIALLHGTLIDPNAELALKVAEVLREIVALSSAVRRRTEGALNAAANLRVQRALLVQRGSNGK
jgi:hypothetical protein